MSMNATPERPVPHPIAWSHDQRKQMMRNVIARLAKERVLRFVNASHIAATYGVKTTEAEAEMMKHLQEGGEGK